MFGEFIPILMLMGLAAVVCTAMVTLSWVLGPKRITSYKQAPYECGVAPAGEANIRFPIKFYLVAILFVLFDVEVVFLWSWISVFKTSSPEFKLFTGVALGIYFLLWILGDVYAMRVGAIDWDESTSLAPEKLESSGNILSSSNAAGESTAEAL